MLTKLKEVVKEFVTVFNQTPKALQLVWQSSPVYTLLMGGLTLLHSLIPVSQVWVGKLIVDAVVKAVSQPGPQALGQIAFFVFLEFLFVSMSRLLQSAEHFIQVILQS